MGRLGKEIYNNKPVSYYKNDTYRSSVLLHYFAGFLISIGIIGATDYCQPELCANANYAPHIGCGNNGVRTVHICNLNPFSLKQFPI